MPFRIGVDIDGVSLDVANPLGKYYNKLNRTSFTCQDMKYYDLRKVFGITTEELIELVLGFYTSYEFEDIKPMPGAQEGFAELKKMGAENLSVTSRPADMTRDITRTHMRKYFRPNYRDVYFSTDFMRQSNGDDKARICSALGIGLMIEDNFHYAKSCAEAGIPSIVLSQPWNAEERYGPLAENMHRANSWKDIVRIVDEIKGDPSAP